MATLSGSASFTCSGLLHGGVLAWLVLGTPPSPEARQTIYDQVIRPHENRLVWYHLKDRLPDISPAAAAGTQRAPRAAAKSPQNIVSGPKDDPRPPQKIWMPIPEKPADKPAPLPNVVAVAPEAPPVSLAAPPTTLPLASVVRRPPPKVWTPPVPAPARSDAPTIPEAPSASLVVGRAPLPLDTGTHRPPAKPWTPPAITPAQNVAPSIPEAPSVSLALQPAPLALDPSRRAPPKQWTPPPAPPAASASASLGDAPEALQSAGRMMDASLAIVGLNPATAPEFIPPTSPREAGFSAGPAIRPGGDQQPQQSETLVVPGLLARSGAKDNSPTLQARVLPMPKRDVLSSIRSMPPLPAAAPDTGASKLSNAPDPRFEGRSVYSIAIQMPNITSYYGSWLVWFAERDGAPPGRAVLVRPPSPTRKVDPKYIAAAASERVEGVVRLFAIIRKNGNIDSVALIRHLDDRLDRSAIEALAKWQFEPAVRNGIPIDVDAIFEIPFHLAPRAAK